MSSEVQLEETIVQSGGKEFAKQFLALNEQSTIQQIRAVLDLLGTKRKASMGRGYVISQAHLNTIPLFDCFYGTDPKQEYKLKGFVAYRGKTPPFEERPLFFGSSAENLLTRAKKAMRTPQGKTTYVTLDPTYFERKMKRHEQTCFLVRPDEIPLTDGKEAHEVCQIAGRKSYKAWLQLFHDTRTALERTWRLRWVKRPQLKDNLTTIQYHMREVLRQLALTKCDIFRASLHPQCTLPAAKEIETLFGNMQDSIARLRKDL